MLDSLLNRSIKTSSKFHVEHDEDERKTLLQQKGGIITVYLVLLWSIVHKGELHLTEVWTTVGYFQNGTY